MKKIFYLLPILLVLVVFQSCDDNDDPAILEVQTIADLASASPNLSSLVSALQRADLVNELRGTGPFTVLAPDNDAFAAFLAANNFDALEDVPVDVLTQVLLNHVIAGSLESTQLSTGYATTSATSSASGTAMSIYIDTSDGVTFNGISTVDNANIRADNGVIHIVDAVIGLPTVVDFAVADPNFSILETALTTETPMTDFAGILSRTMTGNADNIDPSFTVFAPTNTAFQDLLDSNMMWNDLSDIDDALLTNVLLHHVVGGANVRSTDLTPNGNTMAPSLEGDMITITLPGTGDNIADVTDGSGNTGIGIIAVDVQAENGVIHVLNAVLLPN